MAVNALAYAGWWICGASSAAERAALICSWGLLEALEIQVAARFYATAQPERRAYVARAEERFFAARFPAGRTLVARPSGRVFRASRGDATYVARLEKT